MSWVVSPLKSRPRLSRNDPDALVQHLCFTRAILCFAFDACQPLMCLIYRHNYYIYAIPIAKHGLRNFSILCRYNIFLLTIYTQIYLPDRKDLCLRCFNRRYQNSTTLNTPPSKRRRNNPNGRAGTPRCKRCIKRKIRVWQPYSKLFILTMGSATRWTMIQRSARDVRRRGT